VSPSNFGERYFSIRDQLASLMAGVASLADSAGLDAAEILPLDELRGGLRRPFVFAVCGEVNAGKSTLLNALFGIPLCRANVVPETIAVMRYVYGQKVMERRLVNGIVECAKPADFLHDFHLIDTPGTNAVNDEARACMAVCLQEADVIFCTLPVDNPWGAAAWNFLAEIPAADFEKVVIVIQQADLRDAADLRVIRGHVRDLSIKRLGRLPPIFAVSALKALEAKRATPINLTAWRESGLAELEDHLARVCCQSPARWAILSQWRNDAAMALRKIEERMEDRARGLREHSRFLDEVEQEIDVMREQFVKRLPHHLADVADAFEHEAHGVTRVLSRKLGVIPSVLRLFTRAKVGKAIERLFAERLKAAVESVADSDATEVIDFCRSHWRKLGPRVEETLGIRLGGDAEMEEAMGKSRVTFVRRLGHAAGDGVDKLSVRRQLDLDLRLRNVSLTSFTAATLLLTSAGAICGALGVRWFPWIFCGLAVIFLLGGVFASVVTRRAITRDHKRALSDACGRFANTLRGDYEEALRVMFRDYAQCLGVVREHLVRESIAIEPRQRRWQEMFLHLKAIEQEI
jgi:ethanolamine utilization protein EutP (predicted NTPase)